MTIELRDYQLDAIDRARDAIRTGKKNVLICAPTGAGKTLIASYLINECKNKGKRANFVVDRLSLLNQTSDVFDSHHIDHGVIQASHPRFHPEKQVQVCSVQTILRRKWPESQLDVIDEAHIVHEVTKKRIGPRERITLGLTATPFTRALGKHFDAIINCTTTNKLIEQGWLSPYRIFSCAEPDMQGVKVVAGEWERKETEKRALQVVGDVVAEYIKHGEDRKFICSAVDTTHVEELQRQFLGAGINAASYTYKDDADDRVETVNEFRKSNSSIRGLITVTAASRGFDVPSVSCIIMARPLRSSLAEHIQLLGRGLRICDGKKDCLVLDHAGNCGRFWYKMQEFFDLGVIALDDGSKNEKEKPKEKPELEAVKCPSCNHMHRPAPFCPECGHEYPKRKAIQHVPGTLSELLATGNRKIITESIWPMICGYARRQCNSEGAAKGLALALYKKMTGGWPLNEFSATEGIKMSSEVRKRLKAINDEYKASKTEKISTPKINMPYGWGETRSSRNEI